MLWVREFLTFSSSLLWKLLSRWWKWISVICRSRESRQETYSPCAKENDRYGHTCLKRLINSKYSQFYCISKRHVEWKLTVISAVHWGQRCPLDVSTEWDLLMMDSRVCSSTSRRLSTIISTSSWTEDSWESKTEEAEKLWVNNREEKHVA